MPFGKWMFGFFIVVATTVPVFSQNKTTVAVLGLDAHNISQSETDLLANRLRSILVNWGIYDVIERTKMLEILEEHGFQQTGCTADQCLLEAGQLLGVQKMIAGSVGKFGDVYTIELRMVDMETARIEASATYDHKGEMEVLLFTGINMALKKLLAAKGDSNILLAHSEGTLIIETDPPEAAIYLDDRSVGKSPKTIQQLPVGAYQLQLIKNENYEPFTEAIAVTVNDTTLINHVFIPTYGYLSILTNPPESKVFIDGDDLQIDRTNPIKMNSGHHLVRVFSPSFYPFQKQILVSKDQTLPLNISLAYGGDDVIRYQKYQNWGIYTSLALISVTAITHLLANSAYDDYKQADSSRDADRFRKRTEIFDKTSLGLTIVTMGISTATIVRWIQLHHLKRTIGLI